MADDNAFTGFPPEALGFLRAVDFYQDRTWFNENKPLYESALKAPFAAFLTEATKAFAKRGVPLIGDPAKGIFRLQRDVRFAKDKRPYKTNAGAILSPDGRKGTPGLAYLHIDPQGCFMAAGFWHPEPRQLLAMRRHILAEPKGWLAVEKALDAKGLALDPEYALKRLPRGFEEHAGSPVAEALRFTSFVTHRPFEDARLGEPELVDDFASFAEANLPLFRFFWTALEKATA
ncbi:TIGR02453 family protein [Acetobacteraceae bacterium H6797]|nr:TIGR02453 family protein [Acetobacteraceae bacterium H6797]